MPETVTHPRYSKENLMQPRIEDKAAFTVVGFHSFGENQQGEIPALWHRLLPVHESIPGRMKDEPLVGLCWSEADPREKSFHYLAGAVVSSTADIPEGMEVKEVPARRYAVFTHTGPLAGLRDTFEKIYDEWLPLANLDPDCDGIDFEYYGERFKGDAPDSELDLYIPLA